MSEANRIFTRISVRQGTNTQFENLRDLIYSQRFGAEFQKDLAGADQYRALHFMEKELNLMDNWLFIFLSAEEIKAVQSASYAVQRFNMNTWIDV